MDYEVIAVYENGVLRLTAPLALPERSRVRITVHDAPTSTTQSARSDSIRQALVAAGLSLLPISAGETNATPLILSQQQREELARRFSDNKPMSELIDEDREDR